MDQYMSSANLKSAARGQLLGHYGTAIGGLMIFMCIEMAFNMLTASLEDITTIPGMIVFFFTTLLISLLSGIFSAGYCFLFLKLSCGQPAYASDVFYAFRNNTRKVLPLTLFVSVVSEVLMLPSLFFFQRFLNHGTHGLDLLLASLSLVILGIVLIWFELTFSQLYYLMLDFPNYTTKQILQSSAQIMKGNKGRLLYLSISFLPLILLSLLSFGIGMLWLVPYMQATNTNFYLDTMRHRTAV